METDDNLPEPLSSTDNAVESSSLPLANSKSYRNFLTFFSGQIMSLLGTSIAQFLVIWWLALETESSLILALGSVLGFGTTMVVLPISGVLVDRWSRRLVIAIVDFLEAVAALVLIGLFFFQIIEIWQILTIIGIRGILQGFHDPAVQSIIPVMVPKEKLNQVNSLSYLSTGIVFLIGPLIGAGTLAIFGIGNIGSLLWVDVVTFLIAVIPLIFIKIPSVKKKGLPGGKASFKTEFKAGISYIYRTKGLLSLLSAFSLVNFFAVPLFLLLPLIIIDERLIAGSSDFLAFALFAQSFGTIAGSLIMSKFKLFSNNVKGVFSGILLIYIGMLVSILGAVFQNIFILCFGLFIEGFALPVANISSQTIWQSVVPLDLQGRVYSVRRFIAQISSPVSTILTGIIATVIYYEYVVGVAALLGIVLCILLWYSTSLPKVEETLLSSVKKTEDSGSVY